MPTPAHTDVNEVDASFSPQEPIKGTFFVEGKTRRGPINFPDELITSWERFKVVFGGLSEDSDFPLLCKIMLDGGCTLRVNNVRHYTDITDPSTLSAVKASITTFASAVPNNLFSLVMKYAGAEYNGTTAAVLAASNGDANYFNLLITPPANKDMVPELYENLIIPLSPVARPTALQSTYLKKVTEGSSLVDIVYSDLSGIAGSTQLRPANVSKTYASGADGGTIVAVDYVGDSAGKTGLYAFDAYDDSSDIAIPELSDATVATGLQAYVEGRKDLFGYTHLSNSNDTTTELTTARAATNISSSYMYIVGGGDKILDPISSVPRGISEIARVLTFVAKTDAEAGPWKSFAGKTRGRSFGSLGVVNNFGGKGKFADLTVLGNRQINMLVNENGITYLKGNFTGQLNSSKLSFASIRRYLIYLKKIVESTVDIFLEEPNHPVTWRKIYNSIYPTLDQHKDEYKAIYDYRWDGDQFITDILKARINNNPTDIGNGKYKAKLYIKPVNSIQWIVIDVVITSDGVDFENETLVDNI